MLFLMMVGGVDCDDAYDDDAYDDDDCDSATVCKQASCFVLYFVVILLL
jgi:hypothetical protein